MISSTVFQEITKMFLILCIISITAKSIHYGDSNQISSDQDGLGDSVSSGLTPLQLEFLAQRLADYNQVQQMPPLGLERLLRNPELVKRQSRYRQCYFNPISCFKK